MAGAGARATSESRHKRQASENEMPNASWAALFHCQGNHFPLPDST